MKSLLQSAYKLTLVIALLLIISGCATTPESSPVPATPEIAVNPDIVDAEIELERAQLRLAEWNIREKQVADHPVPLSQILALAKQKQQDGNPFEASRLAKKVSRFARLGLAQALQQSNARPYYPQ